MFVSSKQDGSFVYAMGNNADSRLGIGAQSDNQLIVSVPTLVQGIGFIKKVATGNSHSVALGFNGIVYSWGCSSSALGQGKITKNVTLPLQIVSLQDDCVTDIETGPRHTIFITLKKVFACGDSSSGQLGLGKSQLINDFHVFNPTEITQLNTCPVQ